ncbi:MAG TPA: hypothetical protein VJ863_03300 [Sphaerochaeta sp.]|nr:hypothetical protein [Sphaerochaeta sp.]
MDLRTPDYCTCSRLFCGQPALEYFCFITPEQFLNPYLGSYNHNGRFYTLAGIPQFDEHGLWGYKNIRFSRFGTLMDLRIVLEL